MDKYIRSSARCFGGNLIALEEEEEEEEEEENLYAE